MPPLLLRRFLRDRALPRVAGSLRRGFDQEMHRNTFLSRQQKLDSDQNLLFMHHHEIQRFSLSNLQQNGLVAFSVPSASVFCKSRFIGACQRVEVFPQPRNPGGAARARRWLGSWARGRFPAGGSSCGAAALPGFPEHFALWCFAFCPCVQTTR